MSLLSVGGARWVRVEVGSTSVGWDRGLAMKLVIYDNSV